jgi:type VI secretion system protein ImpE
MNAKDLIRAGKLVDARKQLVEDVRSMPSDLPGRTLLFQVLSFFGEWDKAERHLDVITAHDPKAETGVQVYKNLITAEKERTEVLERKRVPAFLTGVPPYLETFFAAWDALVGKKVKEATLLFEQVETSRPALSGSINGDAFNGFRDTDTFLAPFLETIVHGHYLWFPFEALRELSVPAPKTLFDLLWTSAHVTTWEGLTINCYLPVLYPKSYLHTDDRVKLGRMTNWTSLGGSYHQGAGQHVFQVGEKEIAILELRDIKFNLPGNGAKA